MKYIAHSGTYMSDHSLEMQILFNPNPMSQCESSFTHLKIKENK